MSRAAAPAERSYTLLALAGSGTLKIAAMSRRAKLTWVCVLYFAQGFPFGIVVDNVPVYFRQQGVSLVEIGLISWLGMPWTFKVLWAPLVDAFGQTRHWISAALLTMALILYWLPFVPPSPPGAALWVLLLLLAFASATQDIAIDAHTIRMLEEDEVGTANGLRVSAYRAALIVSGGGLLVLSSALGWTGAFHLGAALLVVLALVVWLGLPPGAAATARGNVPNRGWQPLREWLQRPGAWVVFLIVLTFKLGDSSMGPMIKPFWVDRGFSTEEIGLVSNTFGIVATVLGALVGGAWTSRWGVWRGLLVFGLLQALSNLGYALAAYGDAGRAGVYAASLCESFTGGMGTAAFLSFVMSSCDKRNAATEYALLSAIFAFTRQLAGGVSGFAATYLGYGPYFALTFVVALPPLALLWLLPRETVSVATRD